MIILLLDVNPMKALVFSQVSLSFALPFVILMLLIMCRERYHGVVRQQAWYRGWIIAAVIIGLNAALLAMTFTGKV